MKESKVKSIAKKFNRKVGFTIVELLTVMSIIIILMGLLAPAMNKVRRYAWRVRQKNQFHSLNIALELFRAEFEGYPNSDYETTPDEYCGATKLAEAMFGQDLLGFHPASRFLADGTDGATPPTILYPPAPPPPLPAWYVENLKTRKEHYLPLEQANAYKLGSLWWETASGNIVTRTDKFNPDTFVLCDVYTRVQNRETGKRVGMPILYYKANTSKTVHDVTLPIDPAENIYNVEDNQELVKLGKPWDLPPQGAAHTLFTNPEKFYLSTWNESITSIARPYRIDSFILLSAGFDGEYGTPDDVFNFGE
jgi:type II secretory pathway pseudopilin PulG